MQLFIDIIIEHNTLNFVTIHKNIIRHKQHETWYLKLYFVPTNRRWLRVRTTRLDSDLDDNRSVYIATGSGARDNNDSRKPNGVGKSK